MVQAIGFKGFKPYLQNWKWVLSVAGLITFTYPLLAACQKTECNKKIVLYALSPIFLILTTPFVMPDVTLQHKTPGKFLLQYSKLINPDTILVSDEDQVRAVCWFYKSNNVYLLAGGGELMYGLQYDDSKNRLITIDQLKKLIDKYPGRIAAVLNFRKYQFWKEKLPKPLFLETNVNSPTDIMPKDGFVFAKY